MGLREDLEALRENHPEIQHLVYGDLSTNMVLFATADDERGQEDHDRLITFGSKTLVVANEVFKAWSKSEEPGAEIVIGGQGTATIISRANSSSDEALILSLSRGADVSAIGKSAATALSQIAGDED